MSQRLEELFEEAIALPIDQRAEFLLGICGDDKHVLHELKALLDADENQTFGILQTLASEHGDPGLRSALIGNNRENPFLPTPHAHALSVVINARNKPRNEAQESTRVTRVIGDYEIIGVLGRGGMGTVYHGYDATLERHVAIKQLISPNPDLRKRFIVEARAMARCSHESIVAIHEVGEHDGAPYLALEYVNGMTLRERLNNSKALLPDEAIAITRQVVAALEHAHSLGIIHRDLKPENIMVLKGGKVRVLDFGIAKLIHDVEYVDTVLPAAHRKDRLTQTGVLIGTLPYMSPEQWNGEDTDQRCDIWAVGIILFEMLAGRHPLAPLSMPKLMNIGSQTARIPRLIDTDTKYYVISSIIERCLCKDRLERIATTTELSTILRSISLTDSARVQSHPLQIEDEDHEVDHSLETDCLPPLLMNEFGKKLHNIPYPDSARVTALAPPVLLLQRIIISKVNRNPLAPTFTSSTHLFAIRTLCYVSDSSSTSSYAVTRLGRSDDCDIVLPYASISRHHATIYQRADGCYLCDAGSTHGTYVHNVALNNTDVHKLRCGDLIRLGTVEFCFITGDELYDALELGDIRRETEERESQRKRAAARKFRATLARVIASSIDAGADNVAAVAEMCFFDLAILAPAKAVPRVALQLLWGRRGLHENDVDYLADAMVHHALMDNAGPGNLRLRKDSWDYLGTRTTTDVARVHGEFIDAYAAMCPEGIERGPCHPEHRDIERYFQTWLLHHQIGAGRID